MCYVWREKKNQSRLPSSSKEFTTLNLDVELFCLHESLGLCFIPCLLPKSIIFHFISNWFKHLSISVSFINFSSSKLCFHKIPPLTEKSSLVVILVSSSTSSERKRSIIIIIIIVEVVVALNGFYHHDLEFLFVIHHHWVSSWYRLEVGLFSLNSFTSWFDSCKYFVLFSTGGKNWNLKQNMKNLVLMKREMSF